MVWTALDGDGVLASHGRRPLLQKYIDGLPEANIIEATTGAGANKQLFGCSSTAPCVYSSSVPLRPDGVRRSIQTVICWRRCWSNEGPHGAARRKLLSSLIACLHLQRLSVSCMFYVGHRLVQQQPQLCWQLFTFMCHSCVMKL